MGKVTSHDDDQASDKVEGFVFLESIFIRYMNEKTAASITYCI